MCIELFPIPPNSTVHSFLMFSIPFLFNIVFNSADYLAELKSILSNTVGSHPGHPPVVHKLHLNICRAPGWEPLVWYMKKLLIKLQQENVRYESHQTRLLMLLRFQVWDAVRHTKMFWLQTVSDDALLPALETDRTQIARTIPTCFVSQPTEMDLLQTASVVYKQACWTTRNTHRNFRHTKAFVFRSDGLVQTTMHSSKTAHERGSAENMGVEEVSFEPRGMREEKSKSAHQADTDNIVSGCILFTAWQDDRERAATWPLLPIPNPQDWGKYFHRNTIWGFSRRTNLFSAVPGIIYCQIAEVF